MTAVFQRSLKATTPPILMRKPSGVLLPPLTQSKSVSLDAMSASPDEQLLDGIMTEDNFASALSTNGVPDPDLIIRTSGERRLSNFLLWNAAYSELYFSEVLWPDFDEDCLYIASPFYPGNIYDNSECVWSFIASDPEKVIQVEFLEWTVVSKNCFK